MDTNTTRRSYDQVAAEYVARIAGELEHKPLDRDLLDRYADAVRGRGTVCDLGCGPGHVAGYLHERGVEVIGIDLSEGMVAEARRLHPGTTFHQGDMTALEVADGAWAGIVAFYSLIHISREHMPVVLGELNRVLRAGGLLFAAFHLGSETRHVEEMWGVPVTLDFEFFERDEMEAWLRMAGFTVEESVERGPYEGVEAQTRRAYIMARKPG